MSTRREGRARAKDKQRRERLRAERAREAELLEKLKAVLGTDAEGGCGALVLRVSI